MPESADRDLSYQTGAAEAEIGLGETEHTDLAKKTGPLPESVMGVVGGVGSGPGIIHPTEGWDRRTRREERAEDIDPEII